MRRFVCVLGCAASLPLLATAQVHDSAVSGRLASASATIPVRATSISLMEVPEDHQFILTQACTSWTLPGGDPRAVVPIPRIVASDLGMIPMSPGGFVFSPTAVFRTTPISTCTVFDPGLALEPGSSVNCETSGPANPYTTCLIAGVLKQQRRGER